MSLLQQKIEVHQLKGTHTGTIILQVERWGGATRLQTMGLVLLMNQFEEQSNKNISRWIQQT